VSGEGPSRGELAGWGLLLGLLATAVALGPLDGLPHVTDEVSYTLQARLFAAGERVGPAGDDPSRLLYPFWVSAPASYSPFPFGWPLLLAVGERLGLASLVNPLLAVLLPGLAAALAGELGVEPAARRLAAAFMALSPGVWVLAASRMSHTSVLLALALAALAVARGRTGWSVGLPVAYVVLARPFDALLVGGPLLIASLWRERRGGLGLLLPCAAATALVGWDNFALTGDPLRFPMDAWFDGWVDPPGVAGCNRLGFGADRGCMATLGSFGHSPEKALQIALDSVTRLDRLLVGLPGVGLLVLGGAARLRRPEVALLGLLIVGGYALYWSPGLAYGARLWHPLYLVLPACFAAGLHGLLSRLPVRSAGAFGLGALTLGAGLGAGPIVTDLGRAYWCVDRSLEALLAERGIEEGVVLLAGSGTRRVAWPALGVEEFACDATLEGGDGFVFLDPTRSHGGLQPRFAPPNGDAARIWLGERQPGVPAWALLHDIPTDRRRVQALTTGAPADAPIPAAPASGAPR
jgi:hypothetical protein